MKVQAVKKIIQKYKKKFTIMVHSSTIVKMFVKEWKRPFRELEAATDTQKDKMEGRQEQAAQQGFAIDDE